MFVQNSVFENVIRAFKYNNNMQLASFQSIPTNNIFKLRKNN